MMSKKKKYAIMAAVVAVDLLVIFIVKDWKNLREGRIFPPPPPPLYRIPSRAWVEPRAVEIENHLNNRSIDFICKRYDANAEEFFRRGVTNWINEELEERFRERIRASLTGVTHGEIIGYETAYYPSQRNTIIVYDLTYEDGHEMYGYAELFKDQEGGIGVAGFGVGDPIDLKKEINFQPK
ncbi:MAG: hypothetical protein IKE64_01375 [Thermoguttaceae bacterium]|nr:hypothetical protein [Thermoguttaceae bacterium]